MKYGLTQAAQATGKSRSSIYRAIKSGVISAHKRDDGQFEIDPAELHRVFPAISRDVSQAVPEQANETAVEVLKREVELLREALERERSHSREFADLLREEREERRRLTALLVHQSQQPEPAREAQHQGQEPGRRTLLEKLFGRRGT